MNIFISMDTHLLGYLSSHQERNLLFLVMANPSRPVLTCLVWLINTLCLSCVHTHSMVLCHTLLVILHGAHEHVFLLVLLVPHSHIVGGAHHGAMLDWGREGGGQGVA